MNEKQIRNLIIRILEKIDMHSKEAEDLVYRTGKVESGYRYIRQIRGPARGFFQCEPWVGVDICKNYLSYRPDMMKKVAKAIEVNLSHFTQPTEENWDFILETNLAAQIAMCRLHYRRIPSKLPSSLKGQAKYWKKYYNSSAGRGTVEDFLERVA
tara:strand:+ start:291 stop:755 length:465 start_codon:yes stop_codon:yes gene_type:complete